MTLRSLGDLLLFSNWFQRPSEISIRGEGLGQMGFHPPQLLRLTAGVCGRLLPTTSPWAVGPDSHCSVQDPEANGDVRSSEPGVGAGSWSQGQTENGRISAESP